LIGCGYAAKFIVHLYWWYTIFLLPGKEGAGKLMKKLFKSKTTLSIVFVSLLAGSLIIPIVSSGATAELNIAGPDDLTIYVGDPANGFYDRKVLSPVNLGPEYAENLGPNPQDPAGFIFRYKLKIPKLHENQALEAVRAVSGIIDVDGNPVGGELEPTGNQAGVTVDPTTVDEVPVVDFWVYR